MIVSDVLDVSDLKIPSGRRRRRSSEVAGQMGATTLGELAELVERYDRMRGETKEKMGRSGSAKSPKDKGNPTQQQQSTTIAGSYTIVDGDEGEEGDQRQVGTEFGR